MTSLTERVILKESIESKAIFAIMLVLFIVFLALAVGMAMGYVPGDEDAPAWLFFVLTALMGLFAWNYRAITIVLTDRTIRAGYGVFFSRRRLEDIASIERFANPWFYGYGTRFGVLKGKPGWMHNAIGKPVLVVVMKEGKGNPFAFSVDDPERIIAAVTTAIANLPR
jgi:hypothetical protein